MSDVRALTLSEVIKEMQKLEETYGDCAVITLNTTFDFADMMHMISIRKDGDKKNLHLYIPSLTNK